MNAEFWRDRISSRSDLAARITHLTRGDTDDEAFEILWKILQEKTLIASGKEGYIVGDKKPNEPIPPIALALSNNSGAIF